MFTTSFQEPRIDKLSHVAKHTTRAGHREAGIAIIGNGFCGTVAAIHLLNLHRKEVELFGKDKVPNLPINRFDNRDKKSVGTPYIRCDQSDIENAFLLTQPADKMSAFSSDTEDFSTWLSLRGKGQADTFGTRSIYAYYLDSCLQEAISEVAKTGASFTLLDHASRVEHIIQIGNQHLLAAHDALYPAKAIIAALGHPTRNEFNQFKNKPGYIENPTDPIEYLAAQKRIESAQTSILVGGGPTTFDAIRALEISGFKGQYIVVSTAPSDIWLFDPRLYRGQQPTIKFTYLDPNLVNPETTYRELRQRFKAEVKDARKLGHAFGHVVYQVPLDALWLRFANAPDHAGINAFVRYILFLRGAATSPETYILNTRLRCEGRLKFVKTRAYPDRSFYDGASDTFQIACKSRSGNYSTFGGTIFANCAQFAKRADSDPLFASFVEKSPVLRINSHGLLNAESEHGVYPVGPVAQPLHAELRGGWGVESFRDEVKAAAESAYRRWRDLD